MLNITPVVTSDSEFSITVQNQMAADDFKAHEKTLLLFFQDKFNNSGIRMNVIVDLSRNDTRILSKAEQLDAMTASNPALTSLITELGLELS